MDRQCLFVIKLNLIYPIMGDIHAVALRQIIIFDSKIRHGRMPVY